jgi:hypothetical protein
MGACEDDGCRDIPPPVASTGGPWVLYWDKNINGNFPYWETVANVLAAAGVVVPPPPPPPVARRRAGK